VSALQDLLRRVREGDEGAASDLVRTYGPHVRRAVRLQLRDPRLRRWLDSVDVCQSVMAVFFARIALGQYDIERPEQLVHLLAAMARNKLATKARGAQVVRRDAGAFNADGRWRSEPVDPSPDPARQVAGRDLLDTFRARLSADERMLSDLRVEGRRWSEIALDLGAEPDALRKKLSRALSRVAHELNLDGSDG
jgi:RNA polymerase sigma-70 factor (ECF subfamily)